MTTESNTPSLAPCGCEWAGLRPGNPDCGCGWGDLCSITEALASMTDREMVAYWNIMQFPGMKIGVSTDTVNGPIVDALLDKRGIPHERGHLTNRV
jgi:hypothetical protein